MRSQRRRYIRRTPQIYGNLQPRKRKLDLSGFFKVGRRLAWAAGIAAVFYLVMVSSVFRIKTVEVIGATLLEPSVLAAQVPRGGSIWTFSKEKLQQDLEAKNPTIEEMHILRGLPDGLRIEIKERSALAVWLSGTFAYVLDADGIAFLKYNQTELPSTDLVVGQTLQQLPHITDQSGLPIELGEQVTSSLFLRFVMEANTQMAALAPLYPVQAFEIGKSTYDVTVITEPGLRIQLDSLGDPDVQIRNFARLVRDDKVTGASNVDLRIDRWAYVR